MRETRLSASLGPCGPVRGFGWSEGGQLVPEVRAKSEPGSYQLCSASAEYSNPSFRNYIEGAGITIFLQAV